ncbi:non-ribosomal peptide synthetase [Amycolatopsis sp. WQ 127309]|uniref:non-ribosomal peptide synthetase n=1 Tax=Amycolatopsis sp. WQ 127309 TaxID=2932773 RepID=UPI001FF13CA9|nr:non-ribosomal peptide synthetase [Amycolatopsis sp. WQ 127309]UOZ05532.1 non-ribosomal peptide synthetase [Amycolatopsis sp. WQ 127309]
MSDAFVEHSTTIVSRFTEVARLSPERIALAAGEGELTYAALDDRSDRLAAALVATGVQSGDVVAVEAGRGIATIVALLSILKAGAAYLALDSRYPARHRELLLGDAGVKVLLVPDDRAMVLPAGVRAVRSDVEHPALGFLRPEVRAEDVAYLAYTSGSTGVPKGVCVPHRAVGRLVVGADFLPIGPDDVFLHFAPAAFDASTLEIWGPLLNGARLVLAPPHDLPVTELTKFAGQHGVTILWLTAGLFHQAVETGLDDLRGLRYLIAGGDVVSPAHVRRALAALPGTSVVNGYGPTENTTFTCCHRVTGPTYDSVPIGRPIRGTGVHVLDENLTPVPDGTIGELYATGAGLAHGYWGSPALTAERFLPDTVSGAPGQRMYRTGDLVRRRPDGVLLYHGRTDQQVKVRGFRIELGAVEAALAEVPGVADAVAVVEAGSRLVAWVVATPGTRLSTLDIRRQLGDVLPAYALPARIRLAAELPLTANGKVDRSALASETSADRPELSAEYRAPDGEVAQAVATVWIDHLGVAGIGADDDFFELGGHSLLGVRIIGELAGRFGVEVSPMDFYLEPTPAGLAQVIEKALSA